MDCEKRDESNVVASTMWHLVFSKPGQEEVAQSQLHRQGYEVYLPRYRVWSKKRGQWNSVLMPWFPRYLFTRATKSEQCITPVRNTYGVSKLVHFGADIAVVPDDLIEQLRELERQQNCETHRDDSPFKEGDRVRIDSGPLKGATGIIARCAKERISVLLQMLGQPVMVELALGKLSMAGEDDSDMD